MTLALELAEKIGAKVTLLHVYNVPAYVVPDGMVLATPDTLREVADRVDEELARWKAEAGVPELATRTAMGGAADEIITAEKDFDVIVMGTHGYGGIKHALLGSVAEKVVRRSSIPVLTVRSAG